MPKGGYRPGSGRPKGVPNRVTNEAKALILRVLRKQLLSLDPMLEETRFGIEIEKTLPDGKTVTGRLNADPGKAADLVLKMAEFCVPKLGRTEVVGDQGGPLVVQVVKYAEPKDG